MEHPSNTVPPFAGLDWDTTSRSFQPTSMTAPFTPLPAKDQSPNSASSPRNAGIGDNALTIAKFQVCSSCRRKKRKCSLDRPSCCLCLENGWVCEYRYVKKKPGPAKRSGGSTVATPPVAAIIPPSKTSTISSFPPAISTNISDYAKSKLINLYFVHIQVMFPMFCRWSFERDLKDGRIPNKLLYAILAVSSIFASQEEMDNLLGHLSSKPWEIFAQLAERESQKQEDQNASVSLNDIKADVLRTLYEFTNFPGRKAWVMTGTLTRMALGVGLHRIDCGTQNTNLTEFEMEEHRFVWWAVWKLDSAVNTLTGTPYGIDSQCIGTALVSTSVAEFTAGNVVKMKQRFLPTDSSKMWKITPDLLTADTEDGLNMYLLAVCHIRTTTLCRQRSQIRITPELIRESTVLKNTLSCLRLALPDWYFDPSKQSAFESSCSHRARLEALLVLHMSDLLCFLPPFTVNREDMLEIDSISNWKAAVASGEDIAAIFRHWKPEYFSNADPFLSATLWFTIVVLTLHTMSIHGQSEEGPDVRISNALDLLTLALGKAARHWQFSQLLLNSVSHLQDWKWLKIDLAEVLSLLAQLQIPMNPLKQEIGAVNMWQIIENIDLSTLGETSNRLPYDVSSGSSQR